MNTNQPTLFVIETPTHEISVTAMDWQDALATWIDSGGDVDQLLAVFEYATPGAEDTIH